ncbi:MAG: RNA 2',3'-cyclic phosphodiesterase [Thermoprotei archaeon]|nr:MAG: RNA 2',3'-cyclic phosphodiesterase [Thermoprotei archaeon]
MMNMVERIRTFIAIDIVDNSILDKIVSVQRDLSSCNARLKLVKRENIHLTLRFLGEITSLLLEDVRKIVEKIEYNSFKITLSGLGAFPSSSNPRVIWIGLSEGAKHAENIFNFLENELKRIGFRPEPKGFSPHITIARVKYGDRRCLSKIINKNINTFFGSMQVTSINLKKSTLTSTGPIYETLYSKKLVNTEFY